jgi:hypothetical protein
VKLIAPITDVVILGDMLVQRDFIEARRSPNLDRVVQTPECQFWTGRRPLSSFEEHLGEAGIKKTLPALVPRMSYKGLTIGNGAAAVARSATKALGSCSPRKHPAGRRMFTNIDNPRIRSAYIADIRDLSALSVSAVRRSSTTSPHISPPLL